VLVVAIGVVLVPIGFQSFASSSTVTFTATGINFLGSGPDNIYPIHYGVKINGVTYSALANQTIKVNVPAGTYSWSAVNIQNSHPCTECPSYWHATPSSGSVTVSSSKSSAHVKVTYTDMVAVSIMVPLSNGSSDSYPVMSVVTNPAFHNVTTSGQMWQASGYIAYGTAINVQLNTNAKYKAYTFNQWGALMVCTSTNRFAENTVLYASDNCQYQAMFNPS
jgi:hypothetical protein